VEFGRRPDTSWAVYELNDNKTYYGVAAKDLYGGWAHGPQSSVSPQ
jgi:hypothetical protein